MSSENYIIHDQHAAHSLTFTVIDWKTHSQDHYKKDLGRDREPPKLDTRRIARGRKIR